MAHKDQNLNVQLFKFLQMLGAKTEAPMPINVAQMRRELTEAALENAEQDLNCPKRNS